MPKDTIIYIPIEAPKRELTSKTMLATRLAKAGYTTILFEHSFFDRHKWKMPGLYLGKNFFRYEKSKTNKSWYNEMKKSKIDIWYLDEEAGIFPGKDPKSWKIFLDERIDINNLSSKDKILVWGRWQKEHWIEKTNKHEEKNIIITGTPHYDMLQTKYHKYFREFDLNTTGNLENYILINTRFSLVNSHPRLAKHLMDQHLSEANLDEIETVLALTNDDEDNLMVSVMVEKFSKDKRTMALINKPNYSLLQSSLKIDDLIDPRMNTVSSILKHVHKGTIETAYTILNGEYEVIEAEIIETSELINKELKNSNLPDEIRIGAILRKKEIIIPRSNFIFQKEDKVVFLAKRDQISLVESMFSISSF